MTEEAIHVDDHFLPEDLLTRCEKTFLTVGWRYGWASDVGIKYTHWHHEILRAGYNNKADKQVNLFNLQRWDYDPLKDIWLLLQERLFDQKAELLRCYANQHTYGVEGYPHVDSDSADETTIIFYLNREWEIAWGGETAFYQDGDIIRSVVPRFGRMVTFPSNMLHAARGVTRLCPKGRITLMYKTRPNGSSG